MFNSKTLQMAREMAGIEKVNAVDKYGAFYNTNHEGYAVLYEEVQEASESLEEIKKNMQPIWDAIRTNDIAESIINKLVLIQLAAENLAMESAQINAVCQKFIDTERRNNDERNRK